MAIAASNRTRAMSVFLRTIVRIRVLPKVPAQLHDVPFEPVDTLGLSQAQSNPGRARLRFERWVHVSGAG
jgi:hypothetical protein